MFERYRAYIKDNPKGYWFKAKIYGWGWTPVKWQGWFVILGFVAWIALSEKYFLIDGNVFGFFASLILGMVLLFTITCLKGEKPHWRWGLPRKTKNKD